MTETNPPAWALAYEAWPDKPINTHLTNAQSAFRAGYEAASARPAVEGGWVTVPAVFVKGVRGLRDVLAHAYEPDDKPDVVRLNSGRIIDGPDGDALAGIFREMLGGLDDLCMLAAAPPPPVGDHKALIEEAREVSDACAAIASTASLSITQRGTFMRAFNALDRLAAALSQRGADEGWRDIASAPRDGTRVLVLTSSDQLPVEVMSYDGPSDGAIYSGARSVYNWANDAGVHAHDGALLGWIPLPPPPSGADEGAGG